MKPISNETKARYFAMYLGTSVQSVKEPTIDGLLTGVDDDDIFIAFEADSTLCFEVSEYTLLLRPMRSLTEEEKSIIETIEGLDEDSYISFATMTYNKSDGSYIRPFLLQSYQYLQSIGIALPYMEYSVQDLVEAGVIKLIE